MTEEPKYDSREETTAHIARVARLLDVCQGNLQQRAYRHDRSKLESPEKEMFDSVTGTLRGLTYGSPEYSAALLHLKPALDHHYAHNSHHPEHYGYLECDICFNRIPKDHRDQCPSCGNGGFTFRSDIGGMSLFDVLEMLMDWKAAGERHANGCIWKSLGINAARFEISPQLLRILMNTATEIGWKKPEPTT